MATSNSNVTRTGPADGFNLRLLVYHIAPKYLSLLVIALAVNGCQKNVVVPDVAQQDLEQAKQTLAAAGLQPGNITGTAGPGAYVTAQSVAAGQQVPRGSQVELTVETAQPLPDLTKSKVTDAVSTLQELGLKVEFVKEPSDNIFGGSKITAQSPVATTLVRRGSTVALTVATPPDFGAFLGVVSKEPGYQKLNAEYRGVLDKFLGTNNRQQQQH